ncbi:MAG: 3D domain-containing protein [Methylocystaceae bacterium]
MFGKKRAKTLIIIFAGCLLVAASLGVMANNQAGKSQVGSRQLTLNNADLSTLKADREANPEPQTLVNPVVSTPGTIDQAKAVPKAVSTNKSPTVAKKIVTTKPSPVAKSPVSSVAPAKSQSSVNTTPSRGGNRTLTMLATAYDPGPASNGKWAGISYLGNPLEYGIVAVDPNVIPLGSHLYIEGYGDGYAADTGGAIKGNRIDLCFNTYQEAMDFGMKNVQVTILK